jgi:hypothetical protein
MLLSCNNRRQGTVTRGSGSRPLSGRSMTHQCGYRSPGRTGAQRQGDISRHIPVSRSSMVPCCVIATVHAPRLTRSRADGQCSSNSSEEQKHTVGTADHHSTEGVADTGDPLLSCLIVPSVPYCRVQGEVRGLRFQRATAADQSKTTDAQRTAIHNPTPNNTHATA